MSKVNPNNAKLVLKQIKKYIIEFYKRRIEKPVPLNGVPLTAQLLNNSNSKRLNRQ
jgi:hypothetical protein